MQKSKTYKGPDGYLDRHCNLQILGLGNYDEYLASELWGTIRRMVFQRDGQKCQICPRKGYQAHHNSYSLPTLRGDDLTGIVTLCWQCHAHVEFDGERKRSFKEAVKHYHHLKGTPFTGVERNPKKKKRPKTPAQIQKRQERVEEKLRLKKLRKEKVLRKAEERKARRTARILTKYPSVTAYKEERKRAKEMRKLAKAEEIQFLLNDRWAKTASPELRRRALA